MWPRDGIYDGYKTADLYLRGTLPPWGSVFFTVGLPGVFFNEHPEVPARFARLQVTADNSSARARAALALVPVPQTPLVEAVRRHNALCEVSFMLHNMSSTALNLATLPNLRTRAGSSRPRGLLLLLGGEAPAPLWHHEQEHVPPPLVPDVPGAWSCVPAQGVSLRLFVRRLGLMLAPPYGTPQSSHTSAPDGASHPPPLTSSGSVAPSGPSQSSRAPGSSAERRATPPAPLVCIESMERVRVRPVADAQWPAGAKSLRFEASFNYDVRREVVAYYDAAGRPVRIDPGATWQALRANIARGEGFSVAVAVRAGMRARFVAVGEG